MSQAAVNKLKDSIIDLTMQGDFHGARPSLTPAEIVLATRLAIEELNSEWAAGDDESWEGADSTMAGLDALIEELENE